jgi:hypothetical protein
MRAEFFIALVESIDWSEECLRIADVHRNRQSQTAARIPHRIEPLVVHAHEFSRGAAIT